MNQVKQLYSKPIIVKGKNNDWFVFFRYWDPAKEKYRSFKLRENLNRIKSIREKEAEFKALREARETWLLTGWNPITNTFPSVSIPTHAEIEQLQYMTLQEALQYAFNARSKQWAKKTLQDYNSKFKYTSEALVQTGFTAIQITQARRPHYKLILETIQESRSLSNKGYNLYREFLSMLLGELVQWEVLEYNPIEKIATKETVKKVAFRPPTKDQQLLIMNRIRSHSRPYYRFLAVLYGCTIRPKEITGLKIKNLHRLEQIFRLVPDADSSTKTKLEREAVIPDWVMDLLMEMNLHNYNPEWYIFSSRPGRHGQTFMPGPKRMHSNTPHNWWKQIVIDPPNQEDPANGGLGLAIKQYSLKKLSGDDMIRLQRREQADNLLELPKMQMGHTNEKMTEIYVQEHREILKELVKRKMPVL